jgi:hypothetical protein
MKSKILLTSALALVISNTIHAAYLVNIPLEGAKIVFEDPQVTGDITLTPTTINRGESSNIIWNYTYADEINIEDVGTYHSLTGSQSVSPTESTVYNVLIKSGDKSKTEKLSLTVIQPDQNIAFSADSYRIGYGASTNLNWNVNNAQSVFIDNGVGSQALSGLHKVTPLTNTTYTLTAKGFTGINDKSQSVDIVVVPDATINSFSVDKETITVGDTSTFSWNVSNAESLTLNGESVNKTTGTKPILFSTTGSFPYILKTTSLSGTVANSESKTVNVYNVPFIASLTANPMVIDAGQPVTLSFDTSYSVYNEINGVNMNSNSTYVVNPTTTTTYTLLSRNPANKEVKKDVVVTVQGWNPTTALYGEWTNVAGKVTYACGVWSPNPSTITTNTTFTQTATCSTDQTRTRQDRVVSNVTGEVKNSGAVVNETQTIAQGASRSYGVTLSAWSGSTVSSCASWTPDPSTVNSGQVFSQTGVSCTLPQTRTRTENYIDHVSGANIQVSVVNQNQNSIVSGAGYTGGTRNATGTKIVQECYPKSTAYQWTYGQLGPQPNQMGTHIVWASTVVLHQIGYGPSSSVNIGSYNYTTNGSNVCRQPI